MIYIEKPEGFKPVVEVIGCFLEYQDKILLLHRQEHKPEGNRWGIPGGKIEKNETPLEAGIREVLEETGFDLSNVETNYLGKVFIVGPTCHYVYHMMQSVPNEEPANIKIQFDSHKGFTWVTPADALKMDLMSDEDPCIKLIYDTITVSPK